MFVMVISRMVNNFYCFLSAFPYIPISYNKSLFLLNLEEALYKRKENESKGASKAGVIDLGSCVGH